MDDEQNQLNNICDDPRYKMYIKPIKQLADNWNIDIAGDLLNYIELLDQITIDFKDGATNLNFAEAAFLIQGSALVYSKKVEYLYSLVYDLLDAIANTEKSEDQKDTKSKYKRKKDNSDELFKEKEAKFLLLDDTITICSNINLNPNEAKSDAKSNMMEVTPAVLTTNNRVGDKTSDNAALRMLNCDIHSNGAVMLGINEEDLFKELLGDQTAAPPSDLNPNMDETDANADTAQGPAQSDQQQAMADNESENSFHDDGDGFVPFDDDDDENMRAPEEQLAADEAAQAVVERVETNEAQQTDEEAPPVDDGLWARHDPHDAREDIKQKEFKRGITYTDLKKLKNRSSTPKKMILTSSDLISKMKKQNPMQPFKQLTSKFNYHIKLLTRTNLTQRREKEKEETFVPVELSVNQHIQNAVREEATEQPQLDEVDDDSDGGYFDAGGFDSDGGADDSFHMQAQDHAMPKFDIDDEEMYKVPETYAEICKAHVRKFIQSASKWVVESNLTSRVKEWKDKLNPVLTSQKRHPPFDIHVYGSKILDGLVASIESDTSNEEELIQSGNVQHLYTFSDLVGSCESRHDNGSGDEQKVVQPYEVCRLFLATLQLANNGNVELHHPQVTTDQELNVFHDDPRGSSFLTLEFKDITLANKKLETYMAPSMSHSAPPTVKISATGKPVAKKRKKVEQASKAKPLGVHN